MRINRGFLGWGVFLLIVGAIPLAVRAGYVTVDQIGNVGSLWPLILIGIGDRDPARPNALGLPGR